MWCARREAAAQQEAVAERERRALEANLRLQHLREKWSVDQAHAQVCPVECALSQQAVRGGTSMRL